MTNVTFIESLQGHQAQRLRTMADKVRTQLPDVAVAVAEGDAARQLLAKYKLKFGPAILINDRLEYVGIPRWRFLRERVEQVSKSIPNSRSAAPASKAPSAKPASIPKRERS